MRRSLALGGLRYIVRCDTDVTGNDAGRQLWDQLGLQDCVVGCVSSVDVTLYLDVLAHES